MFESVQAWFDCGCFDGSSLATAKVSDTNVFVFYQFSDLDRAKPTAMPHEMVSGSLP
jgi:hypothetical protein